VPAFLFKRDVVPGRTNSFQVTLDKQSGTHVYSGKCTEFCGVDHSRMLFTVKVMPKAEYDAWLTATKSRAAGGQDPMFTVYNGPDSISFGKTGNTQRSHQ
jgi:cytochrome c oxidase subunit 2